MNIELWPIDRVIPYARNPRKNDAAVATVAASLREFGWQQPLVVDVAGVLIVGDTRLKAARQLGLAEVPVHVASDLTPAQARAYRIMDNRSSEFAQWDTELLAIEIEDLDAAGYDVDLTGFDCAAIDALLDAPEDAARDMPDDTEPQVDRAEDLRAQWCAEPGQPWVLVDHRLLCGDSTRADGWPMHPAIERVLHEYIQKAWAPNPRMSVSEWAERYRFLSPEASGRTGCEDENKISDSTRTPELIARG